MGELCPPWLSRQAGLFGRILLGNGKYDDLVETRPNDDDGKQVDLILLDDPSLRDLLSIEFSMVVAQSAPVVESPKPPERTISSTQFTVAGQ